jgi:hypothetical protein
MTATGSLSSPTRPDMAFPGFSPISGDWHGVDGLLDGIAPS